MSAAGPISTITIAVSSFLGVMIGGPLSDRWVSRNLRGRVYTSAIGLAMMIPALILVGLGKGMFCAVGAGLFFGIGYGMWDTNNMPILCQFVSSKSVPGLRHHEHDRRALRAGCTILLGKWADGGNLGVAFAVLGAVTLLALLSQLLFLKPTTDDMP